MARNVTKQEDRLIVADTFEVNGWTYTKEEILACQANDLQRVKRYQGKGKSRKENGLVCNYLLNLTDVDRDTREHVLEHLAILSMGSIACLDNRPVECTNGWFQAEMWDGKPVFRLDVTKETDIGLCTCTYFFDAETTTYVGEFEGWNLKDGRNVHYNMGAILKAAQSNVHDGKVNDQIIFKGAVYTKEWLVAERARVIGNFNKRGDGNASGRGKAIRKFIQTDIFADLGMLSLGCVEIQRDQPIKGSLDWDKWFQVEHDTNGKPMFRLDVDEKAYENERGYTCRRVDSFFFDCETLKILKWQITVYEKDGTVRSSKYKIYQEG